MPTITGSFSGNARVQTSISLSDQPNHTLDLAEIRGLQKSPDEKWNNATVTYWSVTDLVDGKGTQRGYFVNAHGGEDRDQGTFEGRVATHGGQVTVEGTWQFTGGSGKFNGLTGKGTFKTRLISPTEVEATWQGAYEHAGVKAKGA